MVMLKICKHTFYAYVSQIWKLMQFTCFIRKVFATKIMLSGKFSFFLTLGALNLAAVARTTHNVENWTRLSNLKVSSAAAALAQLINCTIKRLWGMHQTWEGRGTVSVRRGLNVMETDLTSSDYCSSCTSLILHTAPELHFRMRSPMSEIDSTQWFFFFRREDK